MTGRRWVPRCDPSMSMSDNVLYHIYRHGLLLEAVPPFERACSLGTRIEEIENGSPGIQRRGPEGPVRTMGKVRGRQTQERSPEPRSLSECRQRPRAKAGLGVCTNEGS